MKALLSLVATATLLVATPASADDSIVGVWKLLSFDRTVVGGSTTKFMGEHPSGYSVYTKGGRSFTLGFADGRKAPEKIPGTDAEKVALYDSMYAFTGTWELKGDELTITVDSTWNQTWVGTKLGRTVKIDGNKMTVRTAPIKSSADGSEVFVVATYERVE